MKQTKTIQLAGYIMYFKRDSKGFTAHIKRADEKTPFIGSFFTKQLTAEKWAINIVAQQLQPKAAPLSTFLDDLNIPKHETKI